MNRACITLSLIVVSACAEHPTTPPASHIPPDVPQLVLFIFPDSMSLPVGGSGGVRGVVLDESRERFVEAPVVFTSRDTSVARVSAKGLATAVALGRTWLVVATGETRDSIVVEVRKPVYAIYVSPTTLDLLVGDTARVTATVSSDLGEFFTTTTPPLASSDTTICTLPMPGIIRARAPGITTVRVTYGDTAVVITVRVGTGTRISLSHHAVALRVGGMTSVTAWVSGNVAAAMYASSDPTVFTVDSGGTVRGVGTGAAILRASFADGRDSATVSVIRGMFTPEQVSLAGSSWGVTASRDRVYVTTLSSGALSSLTLPDLAPASRVIPVGSLPEDIAVTADGGAAYITLHGDRAVAFVDLASGAVVVHPLPERPWRVLLSRDEAVLFITTEGGRVLVVDRRTAALLTEIEGPGAAARGIALSPDGATLYVSDNIGRVAEIGTAERALRRIFTVGGRFQDIAVSPSGDALYIANEAGPARIVSTVTGRITRMLPVGYVYGLKVSPDGALIVATSNSGGEVVVIDQRTLRVLDTVTNLEGVRRIAFDHRNGDIFVTDGTDRLLILRR